MHSTIIPAGKVRPRNRANVVVRLRRAPSVYSFNNCHAASLSNTSILCALCAVVHPPIQISPLINKKSGCPAAFKATVPLLQFAEKFQFEISRAGGRSRNITPALDDRIPMKPLKSRARLSARRHRSWRTGRPTPRAAQTRRTRARRRLPGLATTRAHRIERRTPLRHRRMFLPVSESLSSSYRLSRTSVNRRRALAARR